MCTKCFDVKNWLTFVFVMFLLSTVAQLDTIHYFPPLHSRDNAQVADHYLYLSTPSPTPFVVTITDASGTLITTETISQSNPARYQVGTNQTSGSPLFLDRPNIYTVQTNRGIIASATEEFYAEVRTRGGVQAECFTGKGRNARGRIFRIGGVPQFTGTTTDRSFTVGFLSLENNNSITISDFDPGVTFALPVGTVTPGGTVTINLNAGETFVFSGYNDVPANLDGIIGALVVSSGDVVITNGAMNGNIHPTASGSRDQALDQIVPTNKLGTDHIVVEGNGNAEMERPMVIAHVDTTEIFINGNAVPIATLNAGQYFLIPNTSYQGVGHRNMFIRTSFPSYVYQHLAGSTSSATGGMCLIPFFHCRLSNTIDLIPDVELIGATSHSGGILITTEAGATVTVNGVPQVGAVAVVGGPYETYKITGATGGQVIASTGSIMAGIFGASGSVGYAGYYAGFADVPNSDVEHVAGASTFCVGDTGNIAFIGNGGIDEYNFYYTLNGVPNIVTSTSDTLFVPVDTSLPGTLTYTLNGIETYDLDTVNLCYYPSLSTQVIEIDPCDLPVELESFSGSCSDDLIQLDWITASERNNAYFIVLASVDGMNWEEVYQVSGSGNTSAESVYSAFIQRSDIFAYVTYFKLVQVDFDGTLEEFPIISVKCNSNYPDGITVVPNPSQGVVTVHSKTTLEAIQVFNSLGQIIFAIDKGIGEFSHQLNLSQCASGVYVIRAQDELGIVHTARVVKE